MTTNSKSDLKQLIQYTKKQAEKAHADLDQRMSEIPSACRAGCSACCYQMISVHTWEEELIARYIKGTMHAKTKAKVRRQMVEWWRYLKSALRSSTRENPISLAESKQLTMRMIYDRVMCPFLVDEHCSIYPVRPAMCRAHVVPSEPERCASEPGRVGDLRAASHLLATFGAESPHFPVDRYYHAMKPLAFAMTGAVGVAVPSTPMEGVMLGDLLFTAIRR